MSKVLTFSRTYPSYHPRKGEPTHFVEKFHWWFWNTKHLYCSASDMVEELNKHLPDKLVQDFLDSLDQESNLEGIEKHHTIRAGHRFKAGDYFSPRVWSGAPYNSKQIIIAPDIQIPKVWKFEIKKSEIYLDSKRMPADEVGVCANNDGLGFVDFMKWFRYPKPFEGQVICWDESIEYETD